MKTLLLFLSTIPFILFGQTIKSYDYCYESKKGICVFSLTEKKEILLPIKNGDAPYLSPDGTQIAYTETRKDYTRTIAVFNLTTNEKTTLKTDHINCYGPIWSPDGNFIAYNACHKNKKACWTTEIFDINKNTHLPMMPLPIQDKYSFGCNLSSWSSDSKKIIVHYYPSTICFHNLAGEIIQEMTIPDFDTAFSISNTSKFILSDDGSKIIFDCAVLTDDDIWGFNEPPYAIFVYDIEHGITKRITPKRYNCRSPFVKNDKVYFNCYRPNSKSRNIYSVGFDGQDFKLELKKCRGLTIKG